MFGGRGGEGYVRICLCQSCSFFWCDRKERATAQVKEVDIPEDERRLVTARSDS